MPAKTRLAVAFMSACLLAVGMLILFAQDAHSRPPVPGPVFKAVRTYWHSRPDRVKAFDVIACETGGAYNTTARNGQYLGLFQMGSYARAHYGHSDNALGQARAAYRYWLDAGWMPWSCA